MGIQHDLAKLAVRRGMWCALGHGSPAAHARMEPSSPFGYSNSFFPRLQGLRDQHGAWHLGLCAQRAVGCERRAAPWPKKRCTHQHWQRWRYNHEWHASSKPADRGQDHRGAGCHPRGARLCKQGAAFAQGPHTQTPGIVNENRGEEHDRRTTGEDQERTIFPFLSRLDAAG